MSQQSDNSFSRRIIIRAIYKNKSHKTVITDPESGEIICSNCGMVNSDKIQESDISEWRSFNTIELNDKGRIGTSMTLARHDMGLATVIGRDSKDASGQKLDPAIRSSMNRLRIIDHRTRRYTSTDINRNTIPVKQIL